MLARFLIGRIFGFASGVRLGGFAADHLSWRAPYRLPAPLFVGASAALFVLHRRLRPSARATPRASGPAWQRVLPEFASVLARPWARALLALVFFEGAFLSAPFAFVASHRYRAFALWLSSAGALLELFGLGGLMFALFSRRPPARSCMTRIQRR